MRQEIETFATELITAAAGCGMRIVEPDKRKRGPAGCGRRFAIRAGSYLGSLVVVPRPGRLSHHLVDIYVNRVVLALPERAARDLGYSAATIVGPAGDWGGSVTVAWTELPALAEWFAGAFAAHTNHTGLPITPLPLDGELDTTRFEVSSLAALVAVAEHRGARFETATDGSVRVRNTDVLLAKEMDALIRFPRPLRQIVECLPTSAAGTSVAPA